MKKLIALCLSSTFLLAAAFTLLPNENTRPLIKETCEDKLLPNPSAIGLKNKVGLDETVSYSRTYAQYGINSDGNKCIRFATAVKGDIKSLTYNRTIEGYDDVSKNVSVVYNAISGNDCVYYYDYEKNEPTSNEEFKNHYFWACYTIQFFNESVKTLKNKSISASLTIESQDGTTNESTSKTTSLAELIYNADNSQYNFSFEKDLYEERINSITKLNVNFYPTTSKDSEYSIEYTSSNPNIATVDSEGNVTAKKYGKTIISAKIGEKEATCEFIVKVLGNDCETNLSYNDT